MSNLLLFCYYLFPLRHMWRRSGLMVSVVASGPCDLGSGSGQGHCVMFLGKTFFENLPASLAVYNSC